MMKARANVGLLRRDAENMAKQGRRGDRHVAHVAKGEMVLSRDFMERNPEIMEKVIGGMADMGIDPRTRIVGTPQGPKNPQTGAEEFWGDGTGSGGGPGDHGGDASSSGSTSNDAGAASSGGSADGTGSGGQSGGNSEGSGSGGGDSPNTDPNSPVESDAARAGAFDGGRRGGDSGEGGTDGLNASYTGIGFIDRQIDRVVQNPVTTLIDTLVAFTPIGPLNTVSGLLGGPTVGRGVTAAGRAMSEPGADLGAKGPTAPPGPGRDGGDGTIDMLAAADGRAEPARVERAGPEGTGLLMPSTNRLSSRARPRPRDRFSPGYYG